MKKRNLPIGQSSLESIIKNDYIYVDKTQHIYNLITSTQFNFLSRPRRFGKSLLISTLEHIFKGNKELFKGLWIYDADYKWEEFTVLIFDFNGISAEDPGLLCQSIDENLSKKADYLGVSIKGVAIKEKLIDLVNKVYEKNKQDIVILIDEYDKPIISHLGRGEEGLEIARKNRDVLKSFLGTIKEHSVVSKLRFVLLTGVSKFSKAGVFSELNNLFDLTMDSRYAEMLGITDEEIDEYMMEYLEDYAGIRNVPYTEAKDEIRKYYNGYRFSRNIAKVYNPFSLINFFARKELSNYWFESGTPTFLVNLIKENNYYLPQAEDFLADDTVFSTYEIDNLDITALLFQTGYLTIKDYDPEFMTYKLSYPNKEVKDSFLKYFYGNFFNKSDTVYKKIAMFLAQGDLESFISVMQSIFAGITYEEGSRLNEANFHTLFYVIVSAGGVPAVSQVLNYRGRIDLLVEIRNKVYLFEFKCNQSAEKALEQIQDKNYHHQFVHTDREIYLVGINFDITKRNIAEWKSEKVSEGK